MDKHQYLTSLSQTLGLPVHRSGGIHYIEGDGNAGVRIALEIVGSPLTLRVYGDADFETDLSPLIHIVAPAHLSPKDQLAYLQRLDPQRFRRQALFFLIRKYMERTHWVLSWADAEEEAGRSHGFGEDLMTAADNVPADFKSEVEGDVTAMLDRLQTLNGMPIVSMFEKAVAAGGANEPCDFGYCMAMASLSTGVNWTDNNPSIGIKYPYMEKMLL